MEEILAISFQLFFEFFVQILGGGLLDGIGRVTTNTKVENGCVVFGIHICVGGGLGWLSTLIAPKLFLPYVALRIANLVLAPLIAGAISYWFASWAKARGNDYKPWTHFWHGFLFALMFGLARFAFGVR